MYIFMRHLYHYTKIVPTQHIDKSNVYYIGVEHMFRIWHLLKMCWQYFVYNNFILKNWPLIVGLILQHTL